MWADAAFAGHRARSSGKDEPRDVALGHADGVARRPRSSSRPRAPPTSRTAGLWPSIPKPARPASSTRSHDDAWIREGGGGPFGGAGIGLDARRPQPLVPLRARRLDAPLASTRRSRAPQPKQLHVGPFELASAELVARQEAVLPRDDRGPPGRAAHLRDAGRRRAAHPAHDDDRVEHRRGVARRRDDRRSSTRRHQAARGLRDAEHGRRAGAAGDDDAHRRVADFKWIEPAGHHLQGARRRGGLRAALHAGDDRRARATAPAPARRLRARRRLRAERAQVLVQLLPRVHVPQPARVARLRGARRGLPRQRRLRPRLAHRHLPPHGRQGPRGHRRRREVPGRAARASTRSASASTAAATAGSSR